MKQQKPFAPPRFLLLIMLTIITLWAIGAFEQGQALAAHLFQTIPPIPATPCVTQSAGGYTFAFLGYRGNGDGTTTLTFRVTNTNKQDVSHIAFGTGNWTRMAPTDTTTVTNSLGAYLVVWTNTNGEPGFPSFKFQPQFSGFSQGASDTFNFTVAHFDPTTPLTLQAKAGTTRTPVTLALNSPACNLHRATADAGQSIAHANGHPDYSLSQH